LPFSAGARRVGRLLGKRIKTDGVPERIENKRAVAGVPI
jgi:hypothetical protein